MNSRAILVSLALLTLLFSVTGVTAQVVSPVINYQGRAQDASGQPMTGNHAIALRIYDAQTGGTPLFMENHPSVTFNPSGIFTVVIGGNTPGGIPQTIGFNEPRWLGVTISGFNDGNELPRLRFYGTPYSFEANHAFRADSSNRSATAVLAQTAGEAESAGTALYADSSGTAGTASRAAHAILSDTATTAVGLLLPAVQAFDSQDDPTLRIVNESGTALEVKGGVVSTGSTYAYVGNGVDSTSKHFATAEVVGTHGSPDPGALYRDNVPLAWGLIAADGTVISDFGILRVSHTANNPGVYNITLDNGVTTEVSEIPAYSIVITPRYEEKSGLVFPYWSYASGNSPQAFQVVLRGFETGVDSDFSVVVFGRTEK